LRAGNAPSSKKQYAFSDEIDRITSLSTTAMSLATLLDSYDDADAGYPETMLDLFDARVQADCHLRGLLTARRESVARRRWVVQETGDTEEDKRAAQRLDAALRNAPKFTAVLEHQLSANGQGYALSEIEWDYLDGMILPVRFANPPHRRFVFDKHDDPLIRMSVTDIEGDALIADKWWYTHRTDARTVSATGLLRSTAIWSHFKSLGMRDWLVLADRFGLPYVTGRYEEQASPESKAVLERAVSALGTDGYAVMSDLCEIVIHEMKGGASKDDIHGSIVQECDLQMSKLIAGATLLTETTGQASYAIGRVHQSRGFNLLLGDAEWLADSFVESISKPFVRLNGLKANPPRLKIYLQLDVSVLEQCKIASLCANELGLEIDEEQLRDITLLRRPVSNALVGTKSKGTQGDGEETSD
jgi:phage gp29-like protein